MEQNVIRIVGNPYTKEVRYYWKNDNGKSLWSDLSDNGSSPFSKSKQTSKDFLETTIAHKAYDILFEINDTYNKKSGIEIIIERTEEDYKEILFVLEHSFPDSGMHCSRGEMYLLSAKEVMPQIERIYSSLEHILSKYSDSEILGLVSKYNDAVKPEVTICVMGLYSSGKSAFINSLIGKEILPSGSDPATAKIYKINYDKDTWVSFKCDNVEYRMTFIDGDWKLNESPDVDIILDIKKSISSTNDKEIMLYKALSIINDYARKEETEREQKIINLAKKERVDVAEYLEENSIDSLISSRRIKPYRLDDLIEIGVQFCKNTLLPIDEYKFVIFDTPGSNSEMHKEHVEILKRVLADRTNGLPIFVTNADTLDNTDNTPVIELIEKMGRALDGTSTMVIVNKADEKNHTALEKKREKVGESKVTKWKKDRIFFVSSIISLGLKIHDPENEMSWRDTEYADTYLNNFKKFDGSNNRLFLELYKYNILPHNIEKQHYEMAENADYTEKIFWNSGIRSIENEIGRFGEKFALYNKCTQAEKYLESAIKKLEIRVASIARAIDETQKQIQDSIDKTVKDLEEDLKKKCEGEESRLNADFREVLIIPVFESFANRDRIKGLINGQVSYAKKNSNEWEEKGLFKGATNSTKFVHYVSKKVAGKFDQDVKSYAIDVNTKSDKFWSVGIERVKVNLLEVVYESKRLTNDQKRIAEKVVMSAGEMDNNHVELELGAGSGIKQKQFLWVKWDEFDEDEASNKYFDTLHDILELKNKNIELENYKAFDKWERELLNQLRANLSKINPKVIELNRSLVHYQEEGIELAEQLKQVKVARDQIGKLIAFREVEE